MNEIVLTEKEIVLTHYGNGKLACVKCGESRLTCLTIDHINNDGASDRKVKRLLGRGLYHYLILSSYPQGYQTLCFNCNIEKSIKIRGKSIPVKIVSFRTPITLYDSLKEVAIFFNITISQLLFTSLTYMVEGDIFRQEDLDKFIREHTGVYKQ